MNSKELDQSNDKEKEKKKVVLEMTESQYRELMEALDRVLRTLEEFS